MLSIHLFVYTIICLIAFHYSHKSKIYGMSYENIFMYALIIGIIIIISYNIHKIKHSLQRQLIFSDITPILYHLVFYICIVGVVLFIADSDYKFLGNIIER